MFLGTYNNYLLAGNLCNAFALGEIGSETDFYLVAAEPRDESSYPLLSGHILDSEGQPLFTLVRNTLTINPGHCSKIVGSLLGYEIHDSAGKEIFRVETKYDEERGFVTTIAATFHDKTGQLVFRANSGQSGESIESAAKVWFGYRRGFAFISTYPSHEDSLVRAALDSGGTIYRVLSGTYKDQTVLLDGAYIRDRTTFYNCRLVSHTGEFQAENIIALAGNLDLDIKPPASGVVNLWKAVEKAYAAGVAKPSSSSWAKPSS